MSLTSRRVSDGYASTPAQPINKELSEEAKQRNKELIDALNKAAALPEPVERKDKSADYVYATLGVDENSVISNDDIELSYKTNVELAFGYESSFNTYITITITNKTNKTIFIDQANTFLVSNGESSPYYVPIAYSSSTSKTGDANAGTFAGAMGIHDYQTNVSTSTVYSQRVISIPPMSQKRLDSKSMFPTRSHLHCPGVYLTWVKFGKTYEGSLAFYFGDRRNIIKLGETFSFSYDNSPLKFKFFVTYSFKEDCEVTNSVSLNLFMNKVIGYNGGAWTGQWVKENRINPTFTPKIIFNDFSGCFRGGSEQTRTHTQHVSIFDGSKSAPIAKCSTPSAKTFFRPLSACTPYRHSDTMPPTAKKLPTTG